MYRPVYNITHKFNDLPFDKTKWNVNTVASSRGVVFEYRRPQKPFKLQTDLMNEIRVDFSDCL